VRVSAMEYQKERLEDFKLSKKAQLREKFRNSFVCRGHLLPHVASKELEHDEQPSSSEDAENQKEVATEEPVFKMVIMEDDEAELEDKFGPRDPLGKDPLIDEGF
jgi:hypothetical protein